MSVLVVVSSFVAVVMVFPGLLGAGDLEPPPEAVDGSGNPVSTMKTLDQIPPVWSQKLPASERFVLVRDDYGVLDKETGLVWSSSGGGQSVGVQEQGIDDCYRWGWRLPTIDELASLVDRSQRNPALPSGHPFSYIYNTFFWSATTSARDSNQAFAVNFGTGSIVKLPKVERHFIWCVRGGCNSR